LRSAQRITVPHSSRARRSGDTDARRSQDARGAEREDSVAGSSRTAEDGGGKPRVRFLARSKRGARFRTASLTGGTNQARNTCERAMTATCAQQLIAIYNELTER
jgi:hypothetical protein